MKLRTDLQQRAIDQGLSPVLALGFSDEALLAYLAVKPVRASELPDRVTVEYIEPVTGEKRKHFTRGNWDVVVRRFERAGRGQVIGVSGGWNR